MKGNYRKKSSKKSYKGKKYAKYIKNVFEKSKKVIKVKIF